MKIYVLTEGAYSDYHIITATTSMERAKHIKSLYESSRSFHYSEVTIEEYDDGEPSDSRVLWEVSVEDGGNAIAFAADMTSKSMKRVNRVTCNRNAKHPHYFISVMAETKDEAIKIGVDYINMYKASKEGVI